MKPNFEHRESTMEGELSSVSSRPGVYVMKDANKKIIYVGKAQNLKKRLASYFTPSRGRSFALDIKTDVLLRKIAHFETIITSTEKEALILESNLIKRYRPRYNVFLKDDKRYPSLRLDVNNPYPSLTIVRKVVQDDALYFGPFSSSASVHKTLKVIHKTFKLRKCKTKHFKNRSRPCINHQMGMCLAPCCLDVEKRTYDNIIKEVVLFLKGRTPDLIKKIKKEMIAAAKRQDFERAALLRDKIFALEATLEKQVAVTGDFKDRDILGIARSYELSIITVLFIRGGFLLGTRHFSFPETMSTDGDMIGAFIRQFYEHAPYIPKEVLVPVAPEDSSLLSELLNRIKGEKVSIREPKRGEKKRLVNMSSQNARSHLKALKASIETDTRMLMRLQKRLKTDRIPWRIECIDVSSMAGKDTVAGIVVFEKGNPNPSLYRKYNIKTANPKDDYACMSEVLKRRYGKKEKSKPYPDILMVDGGKGQLNIAVSVILSLQLEKDFQVISIAKKDEKKGERQDKVYRAGQVNSIHFEGKGDVLLFLERIRDEAHRFAISFHRKRRTHRMMHSALDSIPGIGKKRKAALLKHFKSMKKIRAATLEELNAVPGINRKVAENVNRALSNPDARFQVSA
ncbi:MAG: excinuclease ABC subunit UvrC [Desulfobacterales bacterium]|nr:MAG: excinuclease ABC subunit UvrC [Desulfobacterales bacterium]